MRTASVAGLKAHASELLQAVEAGETVEITRRGKPIAEIVALKRAKKPIDLERLRAFRATMPYQHEGAGDLISRLRDENLL